jgi:lysophospholipase L1-like esterase
MPVTILQFRPGRDGRKISVESHMLTRDARRTARRTASLLTIMITVFASIATAQDALPRGRKWVATWAASVQGPYPSGNPVAQPVLDFAFPSPERGAAGQTFRLMVKPDLWGSRMRFRFANTFGVRPLTLDDVFVGLQGSGGSVAAGTNTRATFHGRRSVTIPPGESVVTDPVSLAFVDHARPALLEGRRLAVSFHTPGPTGPMTWHAKALTTSYISAPGSGSRGRDEGQQAFPYTTTSWFFLDAVDVLAPDDTIVVACFGDSITDGTGSTLNGDDRWPDVLARRLHAVHKGRVSVVNAGIGGNQIVGPASYSSTDPFGGGPSALARLERVVLSVAGVSAVVWLEGINDLSSGATVDAVVNGLKEGVRRIRAAKPGIRIIGGTITSSLGATSAAGTAEIDSRRQAINTFIRTGGLFDGVADFDRATRDPETGALQPAFQPNSTTGGPGDRLHPNRAGYQAMGDAVDIRLLSSSRRPTR